MSAPLFKVVRANGEAPFVKDYVWSLPTDNGDGTWTPGAWHTHDGPEVKCGNGLHLTSVPSEWVKRDNGLVCYVADAEEVTGDPLSEDKVIARRARLVRLASVEEMNAANASWDASRLERRRAEDERERKEREQWAIDSAKAKAEEQGERLKKAAEIARATAKNEADAGVESPALMAFRTLVELGSCDSWADVNSSRRSALSHCAWFLRFNAGDVGTINKDFRGSYWLDAESLYSAAIAAGNTSACVSLEKFLGRKPWWFTGRGKRERLHVGASLRLNGEWLRVTSFRPEHINAVRTDEGASSGVVKIRREDLAPPKTVAPTA